MAAPIPDYSKVSLLLPMSGANNGVVFADYSPTPKTITVGGNAKTVTAQSKYYGASGYFDGVNDYLSIADHADLRAGTGDFALGFWMYAVKASQTNDYSRVIAKGAYQALGGFNVVYFKSSGSIGLDTYSEVNGAATYHFAGTVPDSTWSYVEFSRIAGTVYGSVAGTIGSSGANSVNLSNTTSLAVGIETAAGLAADYLGYLQDIVFIKGQGLHSANFTPPTRLIGSINVETRDASDILAPRKYFIVPRSYPSAVKASGTTDVAGVATVTGLPACEYAVTVLSDDDVRPDLTLRRLAA